MGLTWENLLIALIAVLPGFVSAGLHAQLNPRHKSSPGAWVAESVVSSLFLNAVALCVFLTVRDGVNLDDVVKDFGKQLGATTGRQALQYIGILYAAALLWGVTSGVLATRFERRIFGYRLRLTPTTLQKNPFHDVLDALVRTPANRKLRGRPEQLVPWLRVQRGDMVVLGRMRQSSDEFEWGEPIEVYLFPSFVFKAGKLTQRENDIDYRDYFRGLHMRVRLDDIAEVFVAPASWDPVKERGAPTCRATWDTSDLQAIQSGGAVTVVISG
jgi:hypothetical protein